MRRRARRCVRKAVDSQESVACSFCSQIDGHSHVDFGKFAAWCRRGILRNPGRGFPPQEGFRSGEGARYFETKVERPGASQGGCGFEDRLSNDSSSKRKTRSGGSDRKKIPGW